MFNTSRFSVLFLLSCILILIVAMNGGGISSSSEDASTIFVQARLHRRGKKNRKFKCRGGHGKRKCKKTKPCNIRCSTKLMRDGKGCQLCKCCPPVLCKLGCPNGFASDKKTGCEICKCK